MIWILIFCCAFSWAQVSDQEWKQIKAQFEKDFSQENPDTQIRSVQSLGKADRIEASQICFAIISTPDQRIVALEQEKEKIIPHWLKERDRVTQIAMKNSGMVTEGDLAQLKKIELQLDEVQKKITALSLIPFAASDTLKKAKNAEHLDFLFEKGWNHNQWKVQVAVIEAFQKIEYDRKKLRASLEKSLKDKESPIRSTVCDTVASLNLFEMLDLLYPLLEDEAWQVRASVFKALGTLKHEKSIPILIQYLEKEEGRLRQDAEDALQKITGKTFHTNTALWRSWLQLHPDFKVAPLSSPDPKKQDPKDPSDKKEPKEDPVKQDPPVGPEKNNKAPVTQYYGIETYSKRLLFILDISGSMSEPLRTGEETKLDGAKKELKIAIASLDSDVEFLLLIYSDTVKAWQNKMMKASKTNKEAILRFIEALQPLGGTNIYDALQQGFYLAGRGSFDKSYDISVDTIFFLTDGEPTAGTIIETEKILWSVREWNKLRKIQIHTIGLGKHAESFMETLATQNQGKYVKR